MNNYRFAKRKGELHLVRDLTQEGLERIPEREDIFPFERRYSMTGSTIACWVFWVFVAGLITGDILSGWLK